MSIFEEYGDFKRILKGYIPYGIYLKYRDSSTAYRSYPKHLTCPFNSILMCLQTFG